MSQNPSSSSSSSSSSSLHPPLQTTESAEHQHLHQSSVECQLNREILRKSFHLPVVLFMFAPQILDLFSLTLITLKGILFLSVILAFVIELYRKKNPDTWINRLTRKEERTGIAVYPFTILSWFVVILPADVLYPYFVASLSIIPTLLGDAVAAIVGKRLGRHRLPFMRKKTIEGSIAGTTCTLLLSGFILLVEGNLMTMWMLIFVPVVCFFLVDMLEDLPTWLPDNLLSAISCAIAFKLLFFL